MRALLGVLAMLAGCAAGTVDGPAPPDAGDADAAPALGAVDRSCEVQRSTVCRFFCVRNPDECVGRVIEQVPIACDDAQRVGSASCTAFSFDPNVFSPSTWAYCCTATGAQALR